MKILQPTEDLSEWRRQLAQYQALLEELAPRLGKHYPLVKSGFHDFRLTKLEFAEQPQVHAKLTLTSYEGQEIQLQLDKIHDFQINYSASQYRYADSDKLILDDGYGEIETDELTLQENNLLRYEFHFFSGMTILISFENFA